MLYDGEKRVKLFGETINVAAEIRTLKAISGHADQAGLFTWIDSFNPKPQRVFVTHGEEEVALLFEGLLQDKGYTTFVPYSGDVWSLAEDRQLEAGSRALAKDKTKKQKKQVKADSALTQALDRLTQLVRDGQGYSNKLKEKLTRQINDLVRRWED